MIKWILYFGSVARQQIMVGACGRAKLPTLSGTRELKGERKWRKWLGSPRLL